MRILLAATACLALLAPPARGQDLPLSTRCETLSRPTAKWSAEAQAFTRAARQFSFAEYAQALSGPARDAALRAEAERSKLDPQLRAYLAALEDLAYQLRVCAR